MDKKELRKQIKERMKGLSSSYCQEASLLINKKVLALKEYQEAKTVFCFIGVNGEPDTRGIVFDALDSGKRICVPLCIGDGIMEAKEIHDFDDLERGYYGLLEPKHALPTVEPEEIDFAVIPCVTCDRDGNRLGHGKGFYDRYLEEGNFKSAMLCFDKLITDDIPMDPHDKPIEIVVTEV